MDSDATGDAEEDGRRKYKLRLLLPTGGRPRPVVLIGVSGGVSAAPADGINGLFDILHSFQTLATIHSISLSVAKFRVKGNQS